MNDVFNNVNLPDKCFAFKIFYTNLSFLGLNILTNNM